MYILATTKHIRIKQLKHTILHDYYLISDYKTPGCFYEEHPGVQQKNIPMLCSKTWGCF